MELYLWDKVGLGFDESSGELKLVLYLRKVGETWEIYKSDAVMVREWKNLDSLWINKSLLHSDDQLNQQQSSR